VLEEWWRLKDVTDVASQFAKCVVKYSRL